MDFLHPGIEKEFRRWREIVGPNDLYHSNDTIGLHDVLAAHFLIIDYFAEKRYGIGGVGPRSLDLLHSALSRQFTAYGGVKKWNGLYEHCATLIFGLVMNHPFHDANKRTALLSALFLLQRNKRIVTLPQRRLDKLVVAIANNDLKNFLGKEVRYQKMMSVLGRSDPDATIRIVAEFLRRNTRPRDDSARTVTYSELNRAIKRHGFELRNTNGNYINVVRIEPAKVWIFRYRRTSGTRDFLGAGGLSRLERSGTQIRIENGT